MPLNWHHYWVGLWNISWRKCSSVLGGNDAFICFSKTSLTFFQFWRLVRYISISTDSNSLEPKCNGICMAKNIRKTYKTWWNQHDEAQCAPVFLATLPVPSPKFHANSVSNQSFPSLPVRHQFPLLKKSLVGWLSLPIFWFQKTTSTSKGLLLSWNLKHK